MMKCKYCDYDNEPLPGDEQPENCGGCGRGIETALSGRPSEFNIRNYI